MSGQTYNYLSNHTLFLCLYMHIIPLFLYQSVIAYPFLYISTAIIPFSISVYLYHTNFSISQYPYHTSFSIPIYLYYTPFCQDSGIIVEERAKKEPKVIDDYKDIWKQGYRDCHGLHASCASSHQIKM